MRSIWPKLVITCATLIIGFGVLHGLTYLRSKPESPNDKLATATLPWSIGIELAPGMGPQSFPPIDLSETALSDTEFGETSRYMSVLTANEGCKTYVQTGNGTWVPIDESLEREDRTTGDNPYGDSNPFE